MLQKIIECHRCKGPRKLAWFFPSLLNISTIFYFKKFYLIILKEREREREGDCGDGGEGEWAEGERGSPKDSMVNVELVTGLIPGPWDRDPSGNQKSDA